MLCLVAQMFEFYCHTNGDVTFRVYRPLTGDNYEVIAEWSTQVIGCVGEWTQWIVFIL